MDGFIKPREGAAHPASSRDQIVDAAIRMIASHGLGGVSYRGIAQTAGVSLALVNYHFPAKTDLIACASNMILAQYRTTFENAAARMQAQPGDSIADLAIRFMTNALGRDRVLALAWAEIVLDAQRHPESLALSRQWYRVERDIWHRIATAAGSDHPERDTDLMVDLVTGMLFIGLGTQTDGPQAKSLFQNGYRATAGSEPPSTAPATMQGDTGKAAETRDAIVQAAIEIFTLSGVAGIGFRAIAERTGLSLSAPAYHFKSIDNVLQHSLAVIISRTKDRYRNVYRETNVQEFHSEAIIDLTNAIFIREATSFSRDSMAFFSTWIHAARTPLLQPGVATFIRDQERAWTRVLAGLNGPDAGPGAACQALALFVGKLIRVTTTGSQTMDLAAIRQEFATQLPTLAGGAYSTVAGATINRPQP